MSNLKQNLISKNKPIDCYFVRCAPSSLTSSSGVQSESQQSTSENLNIPLLSGSASSPASTMDGEKCSSQGGDDRPSVISNENDNDDAPIQARSTLPSLKDQFGSNSMRSEFQKRQNVGNADSSATSAKAKRPKSTYLIYPWIEKRDDGLYCTYCSLHGVPNQSNKGTWISQPFQRLKDLFERAEIHDSSDGHKSATKLYNLCKSMDTCNQGNIVHRLQSSYAEQIVNDKNVMYKLFEAEYFLFKQEIPHTTNWQALLTLRSIKWAF